MTSQRPSPSWWQFMGQNFPYRQFSVGTLVPLLIFYTFRRFDQPLTGALLAGGWGMGVLAIMYWHSRRLDLFAGLATTVAVIELLGTVITRNPNIYLAASAIDNALYGVLFLGSLLLPRPLIQIFAEAMSGEIGSAEFRRLPVYRSAWQILTALWGIINLLKALWLIAAQLWLPLEVFLVIRTVSGVPLLVAMLAGSYWFPGWYWGRARTKTTQEGLH